jgi:predicted DNA-binding ribbon-helix-helix protein
MTLRKRSLNLAGHATSLAMEPEFWTALEVLAAARGLVVNS